MRGQDTRSARALRTLVCAATSRRSARAPRRAAFLSARTRATCRCSSARARFSRWRSDACRVWAYMAYLPSSARGEFTRWPVLVVVSPCSWPVRRAPAGAGAWRSGRDFRLPRAPPGALARHDLAAQEQLAAPDSPRLTALHGAGEARDPDGAPMAQGLGGL